MKLMKSHRNGASSRWVGTGLALAAAALAWAGSSLVPKFTAVGTDGQTYTPASFTQRPTLIIFLKEGCPSVPFGVDALNNLAAQLKTSVQVIGVVDADPALLKKQAAEWKLKFPLIPDPKKVLIDSFGAKAAFDFSAIGNRRTPTWSKLWPGISPANVDEALAQLRREGHTIPKAAFKPPQGGKLHGCAF